MRDKSHNGGPDELPSELAYSQCQGVPRALRATLDEMKSVVFRQGEPSEDLYLILDGSVSVIVDGIGDPE